MFKTEGNEGLDVELMGIEEIEDALKNMNSGVYIKESECLNVVLVELGTDSLEAAKILREKPTKIISKVVPINSVVETDLESIITKVMELSKEKTLTGDSFIINCVVRNEDRLISSEIKDAVKKELININLQYNEENPEWHVYIEIIGKNTGLSILKSYDVQ